MPDHQKTTKAVRKAPTASQRPPWWPTKAQKERADKACREAMQERGIQPKPRYTVELTTEGWQIKDNVRSYILAHAFGSKRDTQVEAQSLNEFKGE